MELNYNKKNKSQQITFKTENKIKICGKKSKNKKYNQKRRRGESKKKKKIKKISTKKCFYEKN